MSTGSPAGSSPSPRGISASASAPSIDVRTCDPCALVVGVTCQPSGRACRRQRRTMSRFGSRSIATAMNARVRLSCASPPISRRSAGRANRWKVTIADTGLPGRPNT
jgi:hypothetical protein